MSKGGIRNRNRRLKILMSGSAVRVMPPTLLTDVGGETNPNTEISLSWTKSTSGVMAEYRCYIGGVLQQTFVGDVAVGILTGLTAGTIYNNITIRAFDGVNESSDSNSINVTTEIIAPTLLTDAGGETDPITEINLSWTKTTDGVMVNYRIYIGGVLQQTFGDVALGTLTGLTGGTTYNNITVRAWNGVTESLDSNSVNVTTNPADITAPTLSSITIEDAAPTNVVMVFDETVTGTNLGFTLAGTTSTAFDSISGSGTTWTGVLAAAAVNGETITLSYDDAVGDFQDTAGNILVSIVNQAVTNNVASSTLLEFDATNTTISAGAMTNVTGADWTVARNSIATYDNAGTITEVAIDVARIESGKMLIEGLTENFSRNSDDFAAVGWNKRGTLILTSDNLNSPDGTLNADKLENFRISPDGDVHQIFSSTVPVGNAYYPSFYIKKISATGTFVVKNPNSGASGDWDIDLSLLDTNWNRIDKNHASVTIVAAFVTTSSGGMGLHFQSNANDDIDVNLWGTQIEEFGITSYIKTVTGTATRQADVITITVPVGATQSETWLSGVSQGVVGVTAGNTFTMVDKTTKIIMT